MELTKRLFLMTTVVLVLVAAVSAGCAPKPAAKKVLWDMCLSGGPRVSSFPHEDFAKDMYKLTDGLWEIKVHYGAVLAPYADFPDGLKSGLYEAAELWSGIHPGKTPIQTVIELPFMAPAFSRPMYDWLLLVYQHPALVKEREDWNSVWLYPTLLEGFSGIMGKKPIRTVDDFKGTRVRVSATMGRVLEKFGAVIEQVPGSEVRTALERGMIDVGVWPTYAFGAYGIYEISTYWATGVNMGAAEQYLAINEDAWNALPEEWQKLARMWADTKACDLYEKYKAIADAKWLPKLAEKGIEIIEFPPQERDKLVTEAKPVWDAWAKDMEGRGLPGREVLDFAIAKRVEVEAKYKKD